MRELAWRCRVAAQRVRMTLFTMAALLVAGAVLAAGAFSDQDTTSGTVQGGRPTCNNAVACNSTLNPTDQTKACPPSPGNGCHQLGATPCERGHGNVEANNKHCGETVASNATPTTASSPSSSSHPSSSPPSSSGSPPSPSGSPPAPSSPASGAPPSGAQPSTTAAAPPAGATPQSGVKTSHSSHTASPSAGSSTTAGGGTTRTVSAPQAAAATPVTAQGNFTG